jgi:diketogulonate reductase-like aldo/keto reductase
MNIGSDLALRSGNTMPCMGLGTWKLTRNTAETISAALEQGYRMIDTNR